MILLAIGEIINIKPIRWESADLSGLQTGQSYVRYPEGNHPHQPEHGSVEISVEVLRGDFKDITDLIFVGIGASEGRLIRWEKDEHGAAKVVVHFDTIFGHGLAYSVKNFILEGGGIIGLTDSDKKALATFAGQRELLALLASHIIPTRQQDVLDFARRAWICIPNKGSDENASHFLGRPKHDLSKLSPGTHVKIPLHLATILTDELDGFKKKDKIGRYLSFYLRIQDTIIGWPEKKEDFKVFNQQFLSPPLIDNVYFETAANFDTTELLDLPQYDHSLINKLKFSEDEEGRYYTLYSVYMKLALGEFVDHEVNKLFGYPDSIQQCVAFEAERIKRQKEHDEISYEDAADWILLLQVSPYCQWFNFFDEFGDGTIYYLIRQQDLLNGHFDNCQLVIQNT